MTRTTLDPTARANGALEDLLDARIDGNEAIDATASVDAAATGRGAWTDIGMPTVGDPYYDYRAREMVGAAGATATSDLNHRAVMWGVWQIQHRITHYAGAPQWTPSGVFDQRTELTVAWAQKHIGIGTDGVVGPTTCLHLFWPYLNSRTAYSAETRHIVGGIARHESGWDPGAVGFSTPDDLGLLQINGPANVGMTEQQRFSYVDAFDYALKRIESALTTPGYWIDSAIASYGYPAVAHAWATSGVEEFPSDPALNDIALNFVAFVKGWTPGF